MKSKIYATIFCFIMFAQIITFPLNFASAEDAHIPDWIHDLYYFWSDGQITDDELILAVEYLKNKKIIAMVMPGDYDIKSNFLLSILQHQGIPQSEFCEKGWYVTGYFLPVEGEFSDDVIQLYIDGQTRTFQEDFTNQVKTEGWGRTNFGDYLGWYDEKYHLHEYPLDNFGDQLVVGTIAVDPEVIKLKTKILISSIAFPWNEIALEASDIGQSIKGKHIDVYTGEGKKAEEETHRITDYNQTLCIIR